MINLFKRNKRRVLLSILFVLAMAGLATWMADKTIVSASQPFIFADVDQLPHNKVGLLLGTSKLLRSGAPNQYFKFRIDATIALFRAQKIDCVIISGDNSRAGYNEPLDMKLELMKAGISEGSIFLDYAGFRTFDSVVRANKIFGQTGFTVISQKFHNQRAVYIARQLQLDAVGFNARDVDAYSGFRTQVREKLARVKVFLDHMFENEPKFLGEPILIP